MYMPLYTATSSQYLEVTLLILIASKQALVFSSSLFGLLVVIHSDDSVPPNVLISHTPKVKENSRLLQQIVRIRRVVKYWLPICFDLSY